MKNKVEKYCKDILKLLGETAPLSILEIAKKTELPTKKVTDSIRLLKEENKIMTVDYDKFTVLREISPELKEAGSKGLRI